MVNYSALENVVRGGKGVRKREKVRESVRGSESSPVQAKFRIRIRRRRRITSYRERILRHLEPLSVGGRTCTKKLGALFGEGEENLKVGSLLSAETVLFFKACYKS